MVIKIWLVTNACAIAAASYGVAAHVLIVIAAIAMRDFVQLAAGAI